MKKICLLIMLISSGLSAQDFNIDDFQEIKKPFNNNLIIDDLLIKEETLSHSYLGFPFRFTHRNTHIDQRAGSKLKPFSFSLTAKSFLSITQNSFSLDQIMTFTRDPFHYLPTSERSKFQTISFNEVDHLYTDNNGRFILYKKFQPAPLDFRFLWLSSDYANYLNTIDESLFDYNQNKVCFLDNHISPSDFDCEKIAIKNISPWAYQPFHLIFIDTVNKSLDLISR